MKKSGQSKKVTLALSSSKWHWHNRVKTHRHVCVSNWIFQLLKGGIDWWGVSCNSSFPWLELHWRQQILELHKIGEVNLLVLGQQWQHRLRCECHIWWAQCQLINERSWMWLEKNACNCVSYTISLWEGF
jgi:hypothetical protein